MPASTRKRAAAAKTPDARRSLQQSPPPRKCARLSMPPHWDWGHAEEQQETAEEREQSEKFKAEVSALEESFKELEDYQLQVECVSPAAENGGGGEGKENEDDGGEEKGPPRSSDGDKKGGKMSGGSSATSSENSVTEDGEQLPSSPKVASAAGPQEDDSLPSSLG